MNSKIKKGLGRGLSSLIGETKVETNTNKSMINNYIGYTNQFIPTNANIHFGANTLSCPSFTNWMMRLQPRLHWHLHCIIIDHRDSSMSHYSKDRVQACVKQVKTIKLRKTINQSSLFRNAMPFITYIIIRFSNYTAYLCV